MLRITLLDINQSLVVRMGTMILYAKMRKKIISDPITLLILILRLGISMLN